MIRRNTFKNNYPGGSHQKYDGMRFQIIRPLTRKECDIEEVGPMYEIKLENGEIINAFNDEVYDLETKDFSNKETKLDKKIKELQEQGFEFKDNGIFHFTEWHLDDIANILRNNDIADTDKNIIVFLDKLFDDVQKVIVEEGMETIEHFISTNKEFFDPVREFDNKDKRKALRNEFLSDTYDNKEFDGLEFKILEKLPDNLYLIVLANGEKIHAAENEIFKVIE